MRGRQCKSCAYRASFAAVDGAVQIQNYALQCKFAMVEQLYAHMRKHVSFENATAAFRVALKQPDADAIFRLCEQLTSPSFGAQVERR